MESKKPARRSHSPLPQRAAQFHFLHNLTVAVVPHHVRILLGRTFFYIAGEIPFSIASFFGPGRLGATFWSAAALTFLFAFIGQIITTFLEGTLRGADSGRVYFVDDWKNMTNYVLICPVYVGLSSIFFLTLIKIRLGSRRLSTALKGREKAISISNGGMPAFLLVLIVLLFPAVGIVSYMREVLDPNLYKETYWFISSVANSGQRILGIAGIYYALVNFSLQAISVLAILSFAYIVHYASMLGALIDEHPLEREIDFTRLQKHLTQFVYAYVIAKGLVASYMVNVLYTWPVSDKMASTNFVVAAFLILVISLLIVPFPRYYIQMRWFEFANRRADAGFGEYPSYQDLRPIPLQGLSWFLDAFIIANFGRELWLALS